MQHIGHVGARKYWGVVIIRSQLASGAQGRPIWIPDGCPATGLLTFNPLCNRLIAPALH